MGVYCTEHSKYHVQVAVLRSFFVNEDNNKLLDSQEYIFSFTKQFGAKRAEFKVYGSSQKSLHSVLLSVINSSLNVQSIHAKGNGPSSASFININQVFK